MVSKLLHNQGPGTKHSVPHRKWHLESQEPRVHRAPRGAKVLLYPFPPPPPYTSGPAPTGTYSSCRQCCRQLSSVVFPCVKSQWWRIWLVQPCLQVDLPWVQCPPRNSCGHTVGGTAEPSTVAWGRCWLSLFLKILIYLSLPGLSCSTWDFTAKSSRATAEILHATSLFLFIYSFQFFFLFLFFVNSQLFSFSLNPFWDPTLFIPGLSSQKKSGLPKSYFGVNSFTCSSGTYEF